MYTTTMTAHFVVLLLIAGFPFKACGHVTENILYLVHYDHRYVTPAYIGWLPANPDSYKNNMTLEYSTSYASSGHYWTSVAADYHTGNVTLHDSINHWIYLSDAFATPGGMAYPIRGGTSGRVEAMAIDWLAQNVYWVDEGYNWIKMTNYFGEGEALIIDTGLERPSGIACHPSKGYLFWTELGNMYPPRIERSSTSGAKRTTIVTGLTEPKFIAVDTTANRIYWTDNNATESKIESSDLNGDDRRMEVSQPSSGGVFDSISVDEDYIFVSGRVFGTLTEYFIRYYNKTAPSELVFEYNFGNEVFVLDLCVTGPNIQPKPATLPCDGHTCDHFCVSAADGKHECVCRDNYVLYPNGTCSIDSNFYYPPFCVIGRTDAISTFDPSLLHFGVDYKQQYISDILTGDRIITAVTVDIHSNLLFYADDTQKSIYVVRMKVGQYPVTIDSGIGRVNGMAVDWLSLNLYWVDYDQDRLMFSSYDGISTGVMFYDVTKPRAIAVDPSARLMFWTEESPAKVVSCNLDGTNRHKLLDTSLQNPSGIALDHAQRRVYIVGEDSELIYFIDYDGTGEEILGSSMHPATDVTIFQDFLLLAESYGQEQGLIEAIHKISGDHEGLINLDTSVYAIDTADESTQPIPAVTTIAPMTTTSLRSTIRKTTAPVTEAATGKQTAGNDSTLIIIGAAGAVVLIVIILFIIIIIIILMSGKKKRPQQTGATQAPSGDNAYATNISQVDGGQNHIYASPAELKAEPPTYASSIDAYGGNQATGNQPYIATKLDHQFNTQDTLALYSKSGPPLQFLDSRGFGTGNQYVRQDSIPTIPPPQYTPSEDTGYLELRPSVLLR